MLYKSILLTIIFVLSLNAQTIKEGKFIGSKEFDLPSYTTESFLDINEDIQNLANDNKRLLLFFHQNNCPYCARFTNKILNKPEIKKLIQKDFAFVKRLLKCELFANEMCILTFYLSLVPKLEVFFYTVGLVISSNIL
jgi:thioredoxin-related protein